MKQEDRELLLIDLCGRLFYGVKVDHFNTVTELLGIIPSSENVMVGYDINDYEDSVIEDIKPYLRPMSSMTDEEKEELEHIMGESVIVINEESSDYSYTEDIYQWDNLYGATDWLNAHHFDYRGLIEKGLAIAVTKENNPYED